MKLHENIAYAKSILNRAGIEKESPEYQDYLKIREICGNNHGYVGILTKLYFINRITDMDELSSIFNILKNSKLEVGKLNKLTYDEILDIFYDEFSDKKDTKDYELIYKDSEYSYYRVYTYDGILEIGSPAWCLKTKKYWDQYQEKYPDQWVIISNKFSKNLISPNSNYFTDTYRNNKKTWVRFGISLNNESWIGFDDNDQVLSYNPLSWTVFGVINTIRNLREGYMKSFYEKFPGCKLLDGTKTWQKVENKDSFLKSIMCENEIISNFKYLILNSSSTYSAPLFILAMDENRAPITFSPIKETINWSKFSKLNSKYSQNIIEDYARKSKSISYLGIKLKLGLIKEEDLAEKSLIKVDKWYISDWNDNFYIVINTDLDKGYQLPLYDMGKSYWNMDNPMYWYLDKNLYTAAWGVTGDFVKIVVSGLKKAQEPKLKIKKFKFFK